MLLRYKTNFILYFPFSFVGVSLLKLSEESRRHHLLPAAALTHADVHVKWKINEQIKPTRGLGNVFIWVLFFSLSFSSLRSFPLRLDSFVSSLMGLKGFWLLENKKYKKYTANINKKGLRCPPVNNERARRKVLEESSSSTLRSALLFSEDNH